jgi:response regulator RpfG family c-di-GMP phosphodiesterase
MLTSDESFWIGLLPSIWDRADVMETIREGLPSLCELVLMEPGGTNQSVDLVAVLISEVDLLSGREGAAEANAASAGGPLRILLREGASVEQVSLWVNSGRVDRILMPPWRGQELGALAEKWAERRVLTRRGEGQRVMADAKAFDAELAGLRGTIALQKEHFLGFCFRMLHAFDPLSAARTELVVEICRAMGNSHAFSPRERDALRGASWLFDIGLVSLPRSVIYRMREGTEEVEAEDREFFRHHPIIGQTLASFVDPLRSVGEVIRAHHERFDGSGFPDGLAGDRIPWAARCLAVAVAYVESGLPTLEAAEWIQQGSGTQFDPEAVRLFFQAHPVSGLPLNVREVLMGDLEEGMRLAKGITTRSGVLLVPAGQELNAVSVAKLRNHARLHLVTERILVYR